MIARGEANLHEIKSRENLKVRLHGRFLPSSGHEVLRSQMTLARMGIREKDKVQGA